MTRTIVWFSCGVTSAVAAKLALAEHPDAQIVRIRISSEHEDSDRFAVDVAKWLNRAIENLIPSPRDNHFDVIEYHRYVNGPTGARCTRDLKRKIRANYSRPDDLHVFGFDADEADRVADFRENNPELKFAAPLIEAGLTKADCKQAIERAGIELPVMYRLGYANNNCIGCVKGGQGYWNRIRTDFPDVFARMAGIERGICATILRHKSGPKHGERLYLDELDPTAGRFDTEQPQDCGIFCDAVMEANGL
jgi:3'-phosphoadenosine 5'-phosphosulfate sulfotransferase (PAPS reductase)/FAD synthetase